MLQLVPILQMQKALRDIRPLINDASRFGGLLEALTTGPFELVEFKRIFNAYADNIYYVAGSPEANLYMLGGATPSTKQTTQYLLRNEAIKQLGEVADELRYQLKQPLEKRETDVALEYMQNLLATFDEYLSYTPKQELETARSAVYSRST